ncbi:NAD(P)H-dependent oxidoreductase [Desulfovibrio sp. OttesenSCG-928-O18]|nr:NAD(P)H-dependent oxidoreductase [Desulfovibrio sp. OttesenSCG-928-O18]
MTLILACSPRRGGNCDAAAAVIRETGGDIPPAAALRDHAVLPCISCGYCEKHPGECPLQAQDDSAALFNLLQNASKLVIIAPIYFYHLPAHLKALIDRSQPWWFLRQTPAAPPRGVRLAYPVLVGARPAGKRLFEGSLITLRYWLDLFGYTLAEPLTLYGLDGPTDLAENAAQREAVVRYAQKTVFGS